MSITKSNREIQKIIENSVESKIEGRGVCVVSIRIGINDPSKAHLLQTDFTPI